MLGAMTGAIVHRGPDEGGQLLQAGIALGARRLSIIDLPGSHQPLSNEDDSIWTIFNGEIYNFPALRERLARDGHRLVTRGDTETIVHLYEDHGLDFPRHLRGMFAIAVWDAPHRRLVLARDRMGVKPLYYAHTAVGLGFASEIKSLIAGGLIKPALDPIGAELFLAYGYVPGPRTLFEGVHKLDPATVLVWQDGRIVEERTYWTPWDDPRARDETWDDDQRQLLALLRESVRSRMISDVPLGVMLSGGLDSSLITALMTEHSTEPVKTFSIGFVEDREANELGTAEQVAKRLGTDHQALLTSATEHPALLEEALWHLEEPVADLSFLGFLLLARLARQQVTVALCGQGADELFAGYTKHSVAAAAGKVGGLPAPAIGLLRRLGIAMPEKSRLGRALRAVSARDAPERLLAMSRTVLAGERQRLLTPDFRVPDAEADIAGAIARLVPPPPMTVLGQTLYLDTRLALPDLMFLYFDKMSMATSLEVRVPFADHDVVSFCTALPDDRRVWRLRRKELLRRVARGLIDDTIIDQRKRGFFRAAVGTWLGSHRDGVVRETLLDERTRLRGIFDQRELRRLIAGSGGRGRNGEPLLACLLLELWHRKFVDGGSTANAASRGGMAPLSPSPRAD
jgi:asparagine synthase (glutamine-hydrolysing)